MNNSPISQTRKGGAFNPTPPPPTKDSGVHQKPVTQTGIKIESVHGSDLVINTFSNINGHFMTGFSRNTFYTTRLSQRINPHQDYTQLH